MTQERNLNYTTVSRVTMSWDALKRQQNYDERRMEAMALTKLFQLEPRTKVVFGLDRNAPVDYATIANGDMHRGLGIIRMLDGALSMLGPDSETLSEILADLGQRHVKLGVKAQFYPFMGHAIMHALSDMCNDWSEELHEAWMDIYDHLSEAIMYSTLHHTVGATTKQR